MSAPPRTSRPVDPLPSPPLTAQARQTLQVLQALDVLRRAVNVVRGPSTPPAMRSAPADARLRKAAGRLGAHKPSHLGLLLRLPERPVDAAAPSSPELIVLPTIRPLAHSLDSISATIGLAAQVGARLLILCSHEAKAHDFAALDLDVQGVPVAVVDWTAAPACTTPGERTSEHPFGRLPWRRDNDVADKRNFGLLLGRVLGYRTVLFLDDDVRAWTEAEVSEVPDRGPTLTPTRLRQAVQALHRDRNLRAVGWILREFDDNSVVCHARRLVGMSQRSFISAGALLVRTDDEPAFFPRGIYNEDWFFLYLSLTRSGGRGRLGLAGTVCQREYEPFTTRRAKSEEVGDLVAEGLFTLLRRSGAVSDLRYSPEYWRTVMGYRRGMVDEVKQAVKRLHAPQPQDRKRRRAALSALRAASRVYDVLSRRWLRDIPADAVSYVQALEQDARTWAAVLRRASPQDALAVIGDPVCSSFHGVPDLAAWSAGASRQAPVRAKSLVSVR